ncbi:Rv1733c family protein [Streptomyces scabiei]|uniref:Rv1733c family protein n=1 Tax=Streptomyces scabiei TaxID=1930 RepID=UPI0027DF05D3|nr:hypothetical protein [Streptomyces sp. LBUM 1481]
MNGSRHPRRTRKALWRWRNNPLRRREDTAETWIVLAVWVVVLVGGSVTGLMTARAADAVFAEQRADRRSVSAVLLADVPSNASGVTGTHGKASGKVRWTTPRASPVPVRPWWRPDRRPAPGSRCGPTAGVR